MWSCCRAAWLVANWHGLVAKLGVDVTEHAPNGVATSPRIASLPEHSVGVAVVAEHLLSGVGLLLSGMGLLLSGILSSPSGRALLPERGVVVTKRAPSGVATSPKLVSLPERSVIVTEGAPIGVRFLQGGRASLPSGVALSPKRSVIVMVAAINNSVTTK